MLWDPHRVQDHRKVQGRDGNGSDLDRIQIRFQEQDPDPDPDPHILRIQYRIRVQNGSNIAVFFFKCVEIAIKRYL